MQPEGEFDLIAHYFTRPAPEGMLGVGDDCALLPVAEGCELAVSTDMLVENQHFFSDADPRALGHKALAVNLSDLAAMGARPLACTLAISLPVVDPAWLQAFSEGLHALARQVRCPLVGGDTTRSPAGVVISITVMGEVPRARALLRSAARPGDDVWVSGALGAADVALRLLQGRLPMDDARLQLCQPSLDRPTPRLALGQALGGVAHAAIDLSDGLLQDLGHVVRASGCAAELWLPALPPSPVLDGLDASVRHEAMLAGGDVYELCFTAEPSRRDHILGIGRTLGLPVTRIGVLSAGSGIRVLDEHGQNVRVTRRGFDHFAGDPGQDLAS